MRAAVCAVALALAALTAWPSAGSAQQSIVPDGSMSTVVSPGPVYAISGGQARGNNLFHSFQSFSVLSGETASFQGHASIANVLSRVTGGSMSTIDGTIDTRSSMPSANFFFMNPAGVLFGAGAFLDVGGSVHFTTADRIIFPDGMFSTTPLPNELDLLSSAPPQAFGFLSSNPAAITVDGAFLAVDAGQTLSVVGGNVQLLNGAALVASGGTVQIASVASPGNVIFDSGMDVSSFSRLGEVLISGGGISAGTDGFSPGGGTVVIRSGQLIIEGGATITSDAVGVPGAPVGIDIVATDSMIVREGSTVFTLGDGTDGSAISVRAGNLTVTGVGTTIETIGSGAGSGAIDIQVANANILDGAKIRNLADTSGGNLNIVASGTLTVAGAGTEISTGTRATNDPSLFGGDLSITAGDLVVRDLGKIRTGDPNEQAGRRLSITATSVSVSSLAGISSQAFQQTAGAIDMTAQLLTMDAGFINSSTGGVGGAGQILVNANAVRLTNGAQIASSSQNSSSGLPAGCCPGGSITINAPDSLTISGVGAANGVAGSPNSGIFSTTIGVGNAGQIMLSTPVLTLADGGRISVATVADGNAGTITANVGSFGISGGARVDSSTTAGGAGGAINVNGTLSISGTGSGLFSTASSTGNAGAIAVTGPSVTIGDGGTIDSSTTGAGAGGAINLNAGNQVEIASGGSIRADSLGSGLTGNITVAAGDRIMMDNGSISTRAVTSDGGNITLLAPNVIRLGNSQITTSVESGVGAGGNIFIDPQFVILQGSTITANAFGGPGGSITIIANNFLSDATSAITASSALSTPGTVTIQSPENNLKEAIAQLPGDLVDASRLMRGACAARQTGAPSSLAVAGRGGVPADADGYLSSFSTTGAPLARAARQEQHHQGVLLAMASLDCAR